MLTAIVVVGSEDLTRACGCVGTFHHYDQDPYRDKRREKFLAKRCLVHADEAARLHNERQAIERPSGGKKKSKAANVKRLPVGIVLQMTREEDCWSGVVTYGDEAINATAGSVLGLVDKLAKLYVRAEEAANA